MRFHVTKVTFKPIFFKFKLKPLKYNRAVEEGGGVNIGFNRSVISGRNTKKYRHFGNPVAISNIKYWTNIGVSDVKNQQRYL